MINLESIRKLYEEFTGIELHNEEGDALDFYRNYNEVIKPVVGRWHENPIPLTAVKKPFCGVATIDITVLSSPDKWESVRDKMNEFATTYNGTSLEYDENGTFYSISYNCQTCGVISRVYDVGVGTGEVFELNQQLSLIIIESGVSAYDTFLYIDGIQVPFLSLVETKTHTTSMLPSKSGVVQSVSEQEAYGIDLIVPYMNDDIGRMLRDVIDRSTGNEAHCVVLDVGGKKSCHIMQIAQATSNVQPPQNIGINFSMVELQPDVAKYNGMWMTATLEKQLIALDAWRIVNVGTNAKGGVIFWGDGATDVFDETSAAIAHLYTDGIASHDVLIFVAPKTHYTPIEEGADYYGKNLYFNLYKAKVESGELKNEGSKATTFVSNNPENLMDVVSLQLVWFVDETTKEERARIAYSYFGNIFYLDERGNDGKYYIADKTKIQCLIDNIDYINPEKENLLCVSMWDGDSIDGGGFFA